MEEARKGWRDFYPRIHPAAEEFPMLDTEKLKELADDIKANGLKEPITFIKDADDNDVVIDGRNRLAAIYGFIPENERPDLNAVDEQGNYLYRRWFITEADGSVEKSVEKFIISSNIHRRQLNLSKQEQVELIARVLGYDLSNDLTTAVRSFSPEPGERGGSTKNLQKATLVEEAAKVGISKRTVETTYAKARGTYKRSVLPKPTDSTTVVEPVKSEPTSPKSKLQELTEQHQQVEPTPTSPKLSANFGSTDDKASLEPTSPQKSVLEQLRERTTTQQQQPVTPIITVMADTPEPEPQRKQCPTCHGTGYLFGSKLEG